MFLVFVVCDLDKYPLGGILFGLKDAPVGYTLAIAIILWFTVLFANFAEAIAEAVVKHRQILSVHPERMWTH